MNDCFHGSVTQRRKWFPLMEPFFIFFNFVCVCSCVYGCIYVCIRMLCVCKWMSEVNHGCHYSSINHLSFWDSLSLPWSLLFRLDNPLSPKPSPASVSRGPGLKVCTASGVLTWVLRIKLRSLHLCSKCFTDCALSSPQGFLFTVFGKYCR